MNDQDNLDEPEDDPQRTWEWRGSWWSVILPLLLVGAVTLAILAYFYLSN